ncbi:MAG: histidine kinase dimerization/phospho-acceptor domain-containing protein [Acutalibacteraceae bacterium]
MIIPIPGSTICCGSFLLLLGCAVLALTLLAYNRRVARRVVAVSQEVQSIGAGNLYLQLEPKGRDEISQLTASVEQMRLSLLRKTSEEQRALQQNSDLITAMSHDIRNPLTALLGYLDLAKNGQYRSEDELQSYLDAAYGKAEQLKTLTDELFRYSLLFDARSCPCRWKSMTRGCFWSSCWARAVSSCSSRALWCSCCRRSRRCRSRPT